DVALNAWIDEQGPAAAQALRATIMAADPYGEQPGEGAATTAAVPALPDYALMDPGLLHDACPWLDAYVSYGESVSPMTPPSFHESAGLWLVSTVIARRLMLPMAFAQVYPNLFVAWLARTTVWRKTTALDV